MSSTFPREIRQLGESPTRKVVASSGAPKEGLIATRAHEYNEGCK